MSTLDFTVEDVEKLYNKHGYRPHSCEFWGLDDAGKYACPIGITAIDRLGYERAELVRDELGLFAGLFATLGFATHEAEAFIVGFDGLELQPFLIKSADDGSHWAEIEAAHAKGREFRSKLNPTVA